MNQFFRLTWVVAMIGLLIGIAPESTDAQQLIGHWKLDEDPAIDGGAIVDSSSQANDGTLTTNNGVTNQSTTSSVPALGTAIRFDGVDDFLGPIGGPLTVETEFPAGTDARTASFWFRADVDPLQETWIFQQGEDNGRGRFFRFSFENDGFSFGIVQRHSGGAKFYDPVTPIDVGEWIHVAAVVPDGAMTTDDVLMYINGDLSTTTFQLAGSVRDLDVPVDSPIFIGGNEIDGGTGFDSYFEGGIDDVQFYDGALSATDISFLFNNPGEVIGPVGLPGDFDGDGDVDGADFLVWQRELGDTDNLVDWNANYGATAGVSVVTAVPEPASLFLLACAMVMATVASRHQLAMAKCMSRRPEGPALCQPRAQPWAGPSGRRHSNML